MNKKLLFSLIILLGMSMTSYAQTWTGTVSNDWNEPGNWNPVGVPVAGDNVQINIAANITATIGTPGVALNPIHRLRVWANVVVTLDLDLTVTGASTQHAVQLNNTGTLNLGNGVDARTFTISTTGANALWAGNADVNVNVAANSTVNITGAVSYGLRVSAAGAVITNDGTITVTGYGNRGVLVSNGTFNNNGTITVTPTTAATDAAGITGTGICNNSGTMNLSSIVGAGAADNPLLVAGGTFDNNSTGVVNVSCADGLPQGAILVTSGSLLNSGTLNLLTGNTNRRVLISGGTVTNNACGMIDMGGGRFRADAGGTFTNNGLVKTTNSNNPSTAGAGTSTNNGFAITPDGDWGGTNNGIVATGNSVNFDYANACTFDLNAAAPGNMEIFTWAYNGTDVNANAADGTLDLTGADFPNNAGPHTITNSTCLVYDSEFTVTVTNVCAAAVLPIELNFFRAQPMTQTVMLKWQTATEINNDYMVVEHSTNGKDFSPVGTIAGNGNSYEQINYELEHKNPAIGNNLYRLLQVDIDGTKTYSDIVQVAFKADNENQLSVYPTAVANELNIDLTAVNATEVLIDIITVNGQRVMQTTLVGNALGTLQVNDLPKGMYIIQSTANNQRLQAKFLKIQ